MKSFRSVVFLGAGVLGDPAVSNPAPAGSLKVSSESYDLGGFQCGKKEPTCNIYYPTDLTKGPFPIATYGHGMGGQIIDDLTKSVASLGIVVVAPATSGGRCDDHHYQDMLHALAGSKAKPSLHKALSHVDWNRTGIFGHSMGGFASVLAGAEAMKEPSKYNVKVVLASHGYIGEASAQAGKITVPAMFTTGTEDHAGHVKGQFDACPGRPKVIAEVEGEQHMEPLSPGRLNPFDAHFLGCHLANLQSSCDKVFGKSSGDMCQANKMAICDIVKDGPSPTPPTPPTPPGPHPGPHPHPTPSPSPTPDDPPEKCKSCFGTECKKSSPNCHTCIQQKVGKCAQSCVPYPLKNIFEYYCGTAEDVSGDSIVV